MRHRIVDTAQALHLIKSLPHQRVHIFLTLPHAIRALILLKVSRVIKLELLKSIPDDQLVVTLEHLDLDAATDIIELMPRRRKKLLGELSSDLRRGVDLLAQFDPQTAVGLMNIDYIQVDINDSVVSVARRFKVHEQRTGRLPAIIVLNEGVLAGYIPGHQLALLDSLNIIKPFVQRIPSIHRSADHKVISQVFKKHPHSKIVVLGDNDNVIGILYSDDVLKLLHERQAASLYDFAGVNTEETINDSSLTKVRFRYKWLMINLGTAFLAAFTVGLFESTIAKYVLLAVYMPIVAGMGGNAATQTLAVMVRGIALRQISLQNAWPVIKREVGSGAINGTINGIMVAIIVFLFSGDIKIAIILAMAMIINLVVAGLFGAIVPLIMKRLGKDPATSATIFITTATDVLGFIAFLGLATIILD